jgi:agmatine deiminase
MQTNLTPAALGYRFPAEWERHASTWLSYPHNERSWPGKMQTIFPYYHKFIREIARGERVNINVSDNAMQENVIYALEETGIPPTMHGAGTTDQLS